MLHTVCKLRFIPRIILHWSNLLQVTRTIISDPKILNTFKVHSWHSLRTWFKWIIKNFWCSNLCYRCIKAEKSSPVWNTILVFEKMRIKFVCIFLASVQATKNTQAHHKSGFGKYVADDVQKVSVRSISGPKIFPGSGWPIYGPDRLLQCHLN